MACEPDRDVYHRLEDAGVTAFVSYPPAYLLGRGGPLDAKRRVIGEWAAKVIERY